MVSSNWIRRRRRRQPPWPPWYSGNSRWECRLCLWLFNFKFARAFLKSRSKWWRRPLGPAETRRLVTGHRAHTMEEAGNAETTNTGGCGNLVFRTGKNACLLLYNTRFYCCYNNIQFNSFFCFAWEKTKAKNSFCSLINSLRMSEFMFIITIMNDCFH